jgi:hypothetical protein
VEEQEVKVSKAAGNSAKVVRLGIFVFIMFVLIFDVFVFFLTQTDHPFGSVAIAFNPRSLSLSI